MNRDDFTHIGDSREAYAFLKELRIPFPQPDDAGGIVFDYFFHDKHPAVTVLDARKGIHVVVSKIRAINRKDLMHAAHTIIGLD